VYAKNRFFYEFIVLMRRLIAVALVSFLGPVPYKMVSSIRLGFDDFS
jgi:hypothetical protein